MRNMKKSKNLKLLILMIVVLVTTIPAIAQTPKNDNFSEIRVDALSEQKIRDFMREVEASGLSLDQIDQVALSKGMSAGEVKKLKVRVERIRQADGAALRESRRLIANKDSLLKLESDTLTGAKKAEFENQAEKALSVLRSKVFGSDIFRNTRLTFEPNFNIATPQSYRVGPDDELVVDIYGLSEVNYLKKVSPEGTISIPYAGVVQVAGLSLEEIKQKLTSRLSSVYTGIKNGDTFLRVTTGKLRTIKVTIIGEATRPGTYTLSSVSTVFTALYASGGPTENGSYREIEIIRGNRVISKLDVYDFLLRGDQKGNITIRDQDIIRIPVYKSRVEFDGEVKRPRIFEVLPNETLDNVLQFAGGFNDNAYKLRIKVLQSTLRERKIIDVSGEEFGNYIPKSGDKFIAEPILDRFENRVRVEGSVFRPGEYELESGLTLKSLIAKAEGFKENAFLSRAYITRLKLDGNLELISFNPQKVMEGTDPDISLRREDVVKISSIFEVKDEYSVSIDGEIRNPGQFQYSENMTLEDLVLLSGGLREGASISRIEVARRVDNSNKDQLSATSSEIFQISIESDFESKASSFILKPFDIVSVRRSEGYEVQRQVKIEGEVIYPGIYFIARKNERISDLIKRAGGTTVFAYPKGASLERGKLTKVGNILTPEEKMKQAEKQSLKALNKLKNPNEVDSLSNENITEVNNLVGIDLEKILSKPGTDADLFLEEGDLIRIPKQPQTVKISGNVLLPVTAIYSQRKNFKSYISESGGFKQKAAKSRAYVKYANGSVKSTRKLLVFFNDYPRVRPGAEIVVPVNEYARRVTFGEILGSTSGLISLVLLSLTLINR